MTYAPEEPFLEIDVKGGERDHIKAYRMGQRDPMGERDIIAFADACYSKRREATCL